MRSTEYIYAPAYLHILGCKHLIYQFAYELDSEDGLKGPLHRSFSCSALAVLEFLSS